MTPQRNITQSPRTATLADVLERVLDKGVVVAGDIKIKLVDVELLTIQVRLVICTVDKAVEMGMNWWASDPNLSPVARLPSAPEAPAIVAGTASAAVAAPDLALRVAELEAAVAKLGGAEPR